MRNDLHSPDLFGNEAGEDENIDILRSYFIMKEEFKNRFLNNNCRFAIAESRKGVGKSALLKYTYDNNNNNDKVLINEYLKGSDLESIESIEKNSFPGRVNMWQQKICGFINLCIGKQIKFAINDNEMLLVENAEITNFRSRNLFRALFDRLRLNFDKFNMYLDKQPIVNQMEIMKKFKESNDGQIWLYIDDIDENFNNTKDEVADLTAFFSACRHLINSVEGLYLRVSIRSDVWQLLCLQSESLDKSTQYILPIQWSQSELERIILKKILSYFQRKDRSITRYNKLNVAHPEQREEIFELVFELPFFWNKRKVLPSVPLYIFSAGRPRWATHLCRLACNAALNENETIRYVNQKHINKSLSEYGEKRLKDLYKEHHHQCPSLNDLIQSFYNQSTIFTTNELFKHIGKIIRESGAISIDNTYIADARKIAQFLYRICFITARYIDDVNPKRIKKDFTFYDQNPTLLSSEWEDHSNTFWEVHPSYRNVLKLPKRDIRTLIT